MLEAGAGRFKGCLTQRKYVSMIGASPGTSSRDITDLVSKGILVLGDAAGRSIYTISRLPGEAGIRLGKAITMTAIVTPSRSTLGQVVGCLATWPRGNATRPGSSETSLRGQALSRRAAPGFSPAHPPPVHRPALHSTSAESLFIRTIRKSTDDGRMVFYESKHHKLRRPSLTDNSYATGT